MSEDYQMGKDVAALRGEIAELRDLIKEVKEEMTGEMEVAEEHIWETLRRLGICHYQEITADDYVLGPAFSEAQAD